MYYIYASDGLENITPIMKRIITNVNEPRNNPSLQYSGYP